jgi:hypothetical protein
MSQTPAPVVKKNIPAMLADTDFLFRQARLGSDAFTQAMPFPHLLLPALIKSPCCYALYEGLASEGPGKERIAPVLRMLLWELSSSTLLRHFTALTGKPPLLPDPFLIHSGPMLFASKDIVHTAEQEFFARHPETQLQNSLRMELFVAGNPNATFSMDLLDKQGHVAVSHIGSNGCALFVNSDDYYLRYRFEKPALWHSLLAYYYINDHARALNGEEQPRAAY